jgi:hypothetical protein
MHRGWKNCSACKSDSNEWTSRIVDGDMRVRRCACTSASVVAIGSRASAVMPEKLESAVKAERA